MPQYPGHHPSSLAAFYSKAGRAACVPKTGLVAAIALVAMIAVATGSAATPQQQKAPQAGAVSEAARGLLVELGFDDQQIQQAAAGTAVAVIIHDSGDESAQAGAVWIDVPADFFVGRYADVETFQKSDAVSAIKVLSSPPVAADFAGLSFPDGDLADLSKCKSGDCSIKIDAAGLQQLQAVDWSATDASAKANAALRAVLYGYVTAFQDKGDDALPVLVDKKDPISTTDELDAIITNSPYLTKYAPEVTGYLQSYPSGQPAGATELFYWSVADIGLKPIVVVDHVAITPAAAGAEDPTMISVNQLYASHYFHAALQLLFLMPSSSNTEGFLLVSANRSRSDGLSGLTGRFVRHTGEKRGRDSLQGFLATAKQRVEAAHR